MSEMPSAPDLPRRRYLFGKSLIFGAHIVTSVRAIATIPIVLNHLQNRPTTTKQGVEMALIGFADKFDGFLARNGHRILGTAPSKDAKRLDELGDKVIFHAMCLSIVARRLRQHDFLGAAVMGGLQIVPAVRDYMITNHRNSLPEGIDPSPVKTSKWKTGIQNLGLSLLSGFLPEEHNTIGDSVIATSDIMGIIGYRQQVRRDQAAIDKHLAAQSQADQYATQ